MKLFLHNSESGFTLVEVLVALFIIALVILGGGMFFFYGRVTIVREAHRRAAVLVASQRLEDLKAAKWEDIAPKAGDTSHGYTFDPSIRYYLLGTAGGGWIQPAVDGDPPEGAEETKTVDNLSDAEMITKAQWKPVGSQNYLEITVTVNWVDSRSNSVSATTLIARR